MMEESAGRNKLVGDLERSPEKRRYTFLQVSVLDNLDKGKLDNYLGRYFCRRHPRW
jgi:hypothetical protein